MLPGRGLKLENVKRSDAHQQGFVLLPKRWIVERTSGWLSKFRTENSETMILIAATHLMPARHA